MCGGGVRSILLLPLLARCLETIDVCIRRMCISSLAGWSCDLFIFDSRLLWQTVSNTADKSTAMQIVSSGGFLWLNPFAMSVVNCSRAEVIEWSSGPV